MRLLDLTLPQAAENLALDEALLDAAEAAECPPTLRLWELSAPAVIVGRSSRLDQEVQLEACRRRDVPVLRRCSGGAAIVAGPGCLMYSLTLDCRRLPQLRMIDQAHRYVLERVQSALDRVSITADLRGTSDLAVNERKFSGNSLRCKRDHVLYHGTLLYDFPLPLIETLLGQPPRTPEYRAGRDHGEFVTNLDVRPEPLRAALAEVFQAREPLHERPEQRVAELMQLRYGHAPWHETGRRT